MSHPGKLRNDLPKYVVLLQVVWALGAAAWNVAGVLRLSQGQIGLGPTASLGAALSLLVLAAVFYWFSGRSPGLHAGLSLLAAVMCFFAIHGALTRDPSLWPSEFWRWTGIVLNGAGGLACLAAVFYSVRSLTHRR